MRLNTIKSKTENQNEVAKKNWPEYKREQIKIFYKENSNENARGTKSTFAN